MWQAAQIDDVIWFKWIYNIYIKEENQWDYDAPKSASQVWKNFCKVKNMFTAAYHGTQSLDDTKKYSIREGYKWLVGQHVKVPWNHWVWRKYNLLRHSFIA